MCGAYGSGGGGADDFGARWVLVVESGDFWGGFLCVDW
jgi:hypothetical protein